MASGSSKHFGTYQGTGVALAVEIGFKPRSFDVKSIDATAVAWWREGMAAATGLKIDTAAGVQAIAANGFTQSDDHSITVGTDGAINTAGETYYWEADR